MSDLVLFSSHQRSSAGLTSGSGYHLHLTAIVFSKTHVWVWPVIRSRIKCACVPEMLRRRGCLAIDDNVHAIKKGTLYYSIHLHLAMAFILFAISLAVSMVKSFSLGCAWTWCGDGCGLFVCELPPEICWASISARPRKPDIWDSVYR